MYSAGINKDSIIFRLNEHDARTIMNVNYFGVLAVCQRIGRSMLQRKKGRRQEY